MARRSLVGVGQTAFTTAGEDSLAERRVWADLMSARIAPDGYMRIYMSVFGRALARADYLTVSGLVLHLAAGGPRPHEE
jgi:hypothetical protein